MTTHRAPGALPALSNAHRERLLQIISTLETTGLEDHEVGLLRQLSADFARFRAAMPQEVREALQEIDQNEAALQQSVPELLGLCQQFQHTTAINTICAAQLLDAPGLLVLAQQAHELAQVAAEVALRAKHRAGLLAK
ncbi:MAG: hypothetical protein H7Z42_21130 [Roseiflexaceae bacterium]|nr:hypothetical protein [Roseiflexaceae bacterium]